MLDQEREHTCSIKRLVIITVSSLLMEELYV
jgi:hypothetical protein